MSDGGDFTVPIVRPSAAPDANNKIVADSVHETRRINLGLDQVDERSDEMDLSQSSQLEETFTESEEFSSSMEGSSSGEENNRDGNGAKPALSELDDEANRENQKRHHAVPKQSKLSDSSRKADGAKEELLVLKQINKDKTEGNSQRRFSLNTANKL